MNLFDKFRRQKLMSITLMMFTLSVGILIGTLVNTQVHAAKGQSVAPDATPLTVPKAVDSSNEFTKLAKRLEPSVVNITVEVAPKAEQENVTPAPQSRNRRQKQNPSEEGEDQGNPLRQWFGNGAPEVAPQSHEVSGTGFIVDKNGYIVTNNHVVEDAAKIMVKLLGDPKEYRGRIIGVDQETDLAVIKVDAGTPLQAVTIGNSDAVQVGDWAVAVGSPFQLDETVTLGIVSATGRGLDQMQPYGKSNAFQKFIQTDAAINPGNSGGPLVNIRGEVIGVNTMIATSNGGSEGVGFAMPSNMVVRVYNDIIREGRVIRGSIGILFPTEIKPELLRGLGLDHGVMIDSIRKGGPAEKGGLKAEDIIVAINGQTVKDGDDLMSRVSDTPVGNPLTLTVDRDGKKMDFKVVTQDRMELYSDRSDIVSKTFAPETGKPETAGNPVKFGIIPRALTDDEKNLTADKRGVSIQRVDEDSFAEEIGLMEHDIVTAINRQPVNSPDDVRKVAQSLKPGDPVTFRVLRSARNSGIRGVSRQPASEPETAVKYLAGTARN
jgi:serine protease Do